MNRHQDNAKPPLPVEIVLAPSWWHKHAAISFDEDFFYHPAKRVESEKKMEQVLYERWGQFGFGKDKDKSLPVVGGVHLAAGFLLQEMLGCTVLYKEDSPPQVVPFNSETLDFDPDQAFASPACKRFETLLDALKKQYGYLVGDVNWAGVLNLAMDLRGNAIFLDMHDKTHDVKVFFMKLQELIDTFTSRISKETGTTSISVNRTIAGYDPSVFLHSTCTHTMISAGDYKKYLMPIDMDWSRQKRPYGIHHCGPDAHRFAECYAEMPHLDFLDVGWGSNVAQLRRHLPNTFLNIRLSPVKILDQTESQIHDTICQLADDSGDPCLTGFCCINMDGDVEDSKITAIFETVHELREHDAAQRPADIIQKMQKSRKILGIAPEQKETIKGQTPSIPD